jgi:branched-chain amino acid aminotransferase
MNKIYSIINGVFFEKNDAKISISDLSIQRGYGVFDFFRTVQNQPIFLEDHLDRFFYSAAEMKLEPPFNRSQIKELIYELIAKNNVPDSGIKVILTGGYSEDGFTLSRPNLIITQTAFTFNNELFDKGMSLISYEHQRQLPHVKTIDYLQAILLQSYISENHADDVLYHNQTEIGECPRSNFFLVTSDKRVLTPLKNILKGITRKKILELTGFNIEESILKLDDLNDAQEAFITSTTKNIVPVLKIDGKAIGNGRPGKITTEIYRQIFKLKEIRQSVA